MPEFNLANGLFVPKDVNEEVDKEVLEIAKRAVSIAMKASVSDDYNRALLPSIFSALMAEFQNRPVTGR